MLIKILRNTVIVILSTIAFLVNASLLLLTWHLLTLPDSEKQLQHSPFVVEGTWECEELNFVVTSAAIEDSYFMEVTAVLVLNNEEHLLDMNYRHTRGFSHRYSFYVYFMENNAEKLYCYGVFEENGFKLVEFADDFLFDNQIKSLNFTKV